MPRTRATHSGTDAGPTMLPPAAPTPPAPRVVGPGMLGTLGQWGSFLGLPRHCLKREARLGRLTTFRRAGQLWTDGESVLAWLRSGRVRRAAQQVVGETTDTTGGRQGLVDSNDGK